MSRATHHTTSRPARARAICAALPAAVLVLTACGSHAGQAAAEPTGAAPSASTTPPATGVVSTLNPVSAPTTPRPSDRPAGPPSPRADGLIAELDHPFGSLPNTVRLISAAGIELAAADVPAGTQAVTLAGARVLLLGNGAVRSLTSGTALDTVESIGQDDPAVILRGLVAEPSGGRWLWSSVRQLGDGRVESHLMLGSPGAPPRDLLARTENQHALVPVTWGAGGPVLADEQIGIGGYILFRRAFGDTVRLDPATGATTSLTAQTCAFSDLAADGTVACISEGREDANSGGPVTLRVLRPHGPALSVGLPATAAQAGAAYFSPDGAALSLASSPALGDGNEQVDAFVVRLVDLSRTPLPAGLVPRGWTSGGLLIATRSAGVLGGPEETVAIAPSGAPVHLADTSLVVGLGG